LAAFKPGEECPPMRIPACLMPFQSQRRAAQGQLAPRRAAIAISYILQKNRNQV